MLDFERALRSERIMKALFGVSKQEFEGLLPEFETSLKPAGGRTKTGDIRRRAIGGGRQSILKTARGKLAYILFYMKIYPTFDLAGVIFGADRSRCCRWTHEYLSILEKALGRKLCLPARKITDLEELFRHFPGIKGVWLDGTERRRQRPKDAQKQRDAWSGKKKANTAKHLITNGPARLILHLGAPAPGSRHDYRMFKESGLGDALKIPVAVDLGFKGIEKDYPGLRVLIPYKKPKNGALTDEEKAMNREIARVRILSEHTISGVKRLRAVSDIFRNKKEELLDKTMLLGCGLWNLHVLASAC